MNIQENNKKDTLIGFWHGVGDHIIASGAIKRFRELNPDVKIGWAATNRYVKSGIYKYCPHINEIFETHDVWEDPKLGINALKGNRELAKHYHLEALANIANKNGYKRVIQVNLDKVASLPAVHRVDNTYEDLGIDKVDYPYEIWIESNDFGDVFHFLKEKNLFHKDYTFVNITSTCETRNWDKEMVNKFLNRKYSNIGFVYSDDPELMKLNVRAAFEVMKGAKHLVLNNSSFLQAAEVFKKDVDYTFVDCQKWAVDTFKPFHIQWNPIYMNTINLDEL